MKTGNSGPAALGGNGRTKTAMAQLWIRPGDDCYIQGRRHKLVSLLRRNVRAQYVCPDSGKPVERLMNEAIVEDMVDNDQQGGPMPAMPVDTAPGGPPQPEAAAPTTTVVAPVMVPLPPKLTARKAAPMVPPSTVGPKCKAEDKTAEPYICPPCRRVTDIHRREGKDVRVLSLIHI